MFKSKYKFNSDYFKSIPISYKILGVVCCVAVAFFGVYLFVHAGNIDSPAVPSNDSGRMYTLEQIYQKFYTGTAATKQSGGFVEPGLAPGSTMHTLDNIYNDFGTDVSATSGTVAADVRSGKTFFATSGTARGTTWGPVAGTLAPDGTATATDCLSTKTFYSGNSWVQKTGSITSGSDVSGSAGSLSFSIPAGYYSGKNCIASDTVNLISGNIKSGATIFGVAGSTKVLDTTTGTAANGDLLSGKVAFSNGATINGSIANCTEAGNACYASGGTWTGNTGSALTVTGSGGTYVPIGYYPASTYKCTAALTGGSGANGAAAAGQILNDYYAYGSNGANINGTLATGSNVTVTNNSGTTIPADYYNGSQTCTAALTGGSGIILTDGSEIISGYSAYGANGTPLNGSITTQSSDVNVTGSGGTAITAGYYNGTPKCKAALTGATYSVSASGIRSGYSAYTSTGSSIDGSVANCSSNGTNGCYASSGDWASGVCTEAGNACYASGGTWTGNTGSTVTMTSGTQAIPAGYYSGSQNCSANFTAGTGSAAAAAQVLSGYYAYGNTGTLLQGSAYPGAVVTTGQITTSPTTNYAPHDDGDINYRKGLALNYSNYAVNGKYVAVNDLNTGLMWQKCPYGLSDTGELNTCVAGSQLSYYWNNSGAFDAINACENLVLCDDGTFSGSATVPGTCSGSVVSSDWRLPNVKELFSLAVEEPGAIAGVKDSGAPYIDQTFFPNKTAVSTTYWSSTTAPSTTTNAFNVYFNLGAAGNGSKAGNSYYIRCVRGQ